MLVQQIIKNSIKEPELEFIATNYPNSNYQFYF